MVESLTPPLPISPIITIRPVEAVVTDQHAVSTQTQNAVLAPHTIIEGFVLSRDAQNNPILRTPYGDLQLQSTVFLKTGAQVTIQTDATADGRARIITIEGKTPQEYAAVSQAGRGLTQDTITPSTLANTQSSNAARPNAPQPSLQNNASLSALLVSRNAGNPTNNPLIASLNAAAIPPMLQKLSAGTPLKVALLDLQFPAAETVEPAPLPTLPNASQAASPLNTRPAPNPNPAPPPSGQPISARANFTPPEVPAPPTGFTPAPSPNPANPTPVSTPAQFTAAAQAYGSSLNAINPQPVALPPSTPVASQAPAAIPYAPTESAPPAGAPIPTPSIAGAPPTPFSTALSFTPTTLATQPATIAAEPLATPLPPAQTIPDNATHSPASAAPSYAPRVAAAAYQQLAAGTSSYSPSAASAATNIPVASPPVPAPPPTPISTANFPATNAPTALPPLPNPATPIPTPSLVATEPGTNPTVPATPIRYAEIAPTPTNQPPPPGVQAVVIGHEPDGASILHSAVGVVKLYTPQPLPIGSKLVLDMAPDNHATLPLNPALPKELTVDVHATKLPWYAEHEDQLASLAQTPQSQTAATNALETALRSLLLRMPTTGTGLASGLLTFIAAVKAGDARQWLDKRTFDALSNDIPKLAARITADTSQMQELWNQSPIENWAMMLIPIAHQGQIDHARFFVRDDDADPEKQGGGGGKRFLVEIDFSQLGPMQFDGFVRRADGKQFDLVIRTQRTIEPALANDIRTIFDNTVQTTGYGGYLSFQHGIQHFVRPLAELKTGTAPDTGTIMA